VLDGINVRPRNTEARRYLALGQAIVEKHTNLGNLLSGEFRSSIRFTARPSLWM
jgi:hypothetical protein